MPRIPHLRHALFALGCAALAAGAHAQTAYPSRPITLIVPTAPGGTTGIAARMLAEPWARHQARP